MPEERVTQAFSVSRVGAPRRTVGTAPFVDGYTIDVAGQYRRHNKYLRTSMESARDIDFV
jgi:hypothetical protein